MEGRRGGRTFSPYFFIPTGSVTSTSATDAAGRLFHLSPTKSPMSSHVVKGDFIEAAYDFEVRGQKASSRITGTKNGRTFSGKFETLYKGKVVDTGAWKTSLKR